MQTRIMSSKADVIKWRKRLNQMKRNQKKSKETQESANRLLLLTLCVKWKRKRKTLSRQFVCQSDMIADKRTQCHAPTAPYSYTHKCMVISVCIIWGKWWHSTTIICIKYVYTMALGDRRPQVAHSSFSIISDITAAFPRRQSLCQTVCPYQHLSTYIRATNKYHIFLYIYMNICKVRYICIGTSA